MTTSSVINFTIDTNPPKVSILSLENKTYDSSDVPLNFTVSEKASLIKYSLDGLDNSTVKGNTTLTGLPNGGHNITVYAWDVAGSVGTSETIYFTLAPKKEPLNETKQEPFPIVPVAATSIASLAVVSAGLLIHFKRHKLGIKH